MVFLHNSNIKDIDEYTLTLDNTNLERIGTGCTEKYTKFVGIRIDDQLKWTHHTSHVRNKVASANFHLARIKNLLPERTKKTIYNSLLRPYLEYGLLVWGSTTANLLNPILTLQKKAIRNIKNVPYNAHTAPLFLELDLMNLHNMHKMQAATFAHKFINKDLPKSFDNFFNMRDDISNRVTSSQGKLLIYIGTRDKEIINKLPLIQIPKIWNEVVPFEIKSTASPKEFKTNIIRLLKSITPPN